MTLTVLRTAGGSPVAPFVISALKSLPDVRVVAVDADPLSCGFSLADAHYVVPAVASPPFFSELMRICRQESVDLFFPDLDEELLLLAETQRQFAALGTRVLVSSPETIRMCIDKYATYEFFRRHDIPTPKSFLPEQLADGRDLSFPLVVKPRNGRGSKNVFTVTNQQALHFFVDYVANPLVQEYVDGVEYSVDTLSDLEGNFLYCSVRQRIATDSGVSIKGKTVAHPVIRVYSERIVNHLKITGPACLQCIERADGQIQFIEVNPRIGGGAVLSLAAGAPLVSDVVRLARGEAPQGLQNYRTGITMLRYWQELFFDSDVP